MKTPAEIAQSHSRHTLTERARKIINRGTAVVAGAAAVAGTAMFIEAAKSGNEATNMPTPKQLLKNEMVITTAKQLTEPFTLKNDVKVRISPTINNGDNSTREPDNVIDNLIPRGQKLAVANAIPLSNGWVAFERPGVHAETLKEKAQDLVYVDAAIVARDTEVLTRRVDFIGDNEQHGASRFEYSDSDQVPAQLTSKLTD